MSEIMDFIDGISVGKDGCIIPVIKFDDIPKKYVETVFDNGVASIDMTVFTNMGKVVFEGYIRGEYVPYSRDENILLTARRVNRALEESRE